MSKNDKNALASISAGLYLVSAILIIVPFVDLLLNIMPVAPLSVEWRFGAVGLLASFIITPLIGFSMVSALARIFDDQIIGRLVYFGGRVGAGGLVLVVVLFVLDAVQVRSAVTQGSATFDIGAMRSSLKLLVVALATWLIARPVGSTTRSDRQDADSPRVVGV